MGAVTSFLVSNAPKILTGVAVGGTILTAVLASRETLELHEEIMQLRKEQETVTKSEIVKVGLKRYAPAIVTGAVTICCMIGAVAIGNHQAALLEGALSAATIGSTEYHRAVVDAIGEEKERSIRDAVALKKFQESKIDEDHVFQTGKGSYLFMDSWTGRFFRSCHEAVMKSMYDALDEMKSNDEITLNDYYHYIPLPPVEGGKKDGWNVDHPLKMHIHYGSDDKGEPCGIIVYDEEPGRYTYNSGWRA